MISELEQVLKLSQLAISWGEKLKNKSLLIEIVTNRKKPIKKIYLYIYIR